MARESADDKLRRTVAEVVAEALGSQRERDEEAKDPNWARLRKVVREEIGGVLGDLLNDRGDAGRSRRRRSADDDEEDDDQRGGFSLFG